MAGLASAFAAALLAPLSVQAQAAAGGNCGNPFVNHFGPIDYRSATPGDKRLVEGRHFTPGVESLTKPSTTTFAAMAGDVGYTLHVFPNHHRALRAMARLGERHRADKPPGASHTVDCYFQRAVLFAPDDTVARALYAQYLKGKGRDDEARQQLAVATQHAKDNPLSHFNIGLVYLEIGDHERAAVSARRAQELGYPRTELIDRLKAQGHWKDAGDTPAAAASAASAPV